MSWLELALEAAALLAGLCGTWSPCGFSMIETIGPIGHRGGRPTTIAACVTFAVGALVGGVLTFGALALAGAALQGADQTIAYIAAAAVAVVAALAELRGVPILPQLRRQLPEHWRRVMPMPVAAALYGVLLGLGFTTFVLTFGVFALAGIAFALGDPQLGVGIGIAFGVGRALPIVAVAPLADRDAGIAITEAMAGRPAIYRGFRIGDGLALLAAAAALVVAAPAGAAHIEAKPAADPSVAGHAVAFQRPDGSGILRRDAPRRAVARHRPRAWGRPRRGRRGGRDQAAVGRGSQRDGPDSRPRGRRRRHLAPLGRLAGARPRPRLHAGAQRLRPGAPGTRAVPRAGGRLRPARATEPRRQPARLRARDHDTRM